MPPTEQFGKRFVILNVRGALSSTTSYQLLADTPLFAGSPHTFQTAGTSSAFDDSAGNEIQLTANPDLFSWSADELRTDVPVIVTQFTTSGK